MVHMKAGRLREWMQANDKTVQDIASETKIHPNTIYRFLKGEPVSRSTERVFERLIETGPQKAAG